MLQSSSLKQANTILEKLKLENIFSSYSEETNYESKKLDFVRKTATRFCSEERVIAPGMTACVATTLLKMGLCQELSQRFVLEYVIDYKNQGISFIFLNNPEKGHRKEDHMLVFIGKLNNVPERLFVGRGSAPAVLNIKENDLSLAEFIKNNQTGTLADPLLNCAGISDKEIEPLWQYCKKHDLTHVVGVRTFAEAPSFTENAKTIKENANKIAKKITAQYSQILNLSSNQVGFLSGSQNLPENKNNPTPQPSNSKSEYATVYQSVVIKNEDKKEISEFMGTLSLKK